MPDVVDDTPYGHIVLCNDNVLRSTNLAVRCSGVWQDVFWHMLVQ